MRPLLAGSSAVALLTLAFFATADEPKDKFAGFPPIGKHRPGERSLKVLTSDGPKDLLRPRWTRAMGDLGGWPAMYRFQKNIYLAYPHVDGHREKKLEATGKLLYYVSKDEGKTWKELAAPDMHGPPEVVVAGDKVFWYDFDNKEFTRVRWSSDGEKWSEPKQAAPETVWLWGAMYDPTSKMFYAPAHIIPGKTKNEREIRLMQSKDGLQWEAVSTVSKNSQASESVLRMEKDGTMVVLMRIKYHRTNHTVCTSRPPYKEWTTKDASPIIEGEHFFDIAGQTFLPSRALYTGDNPDIKANPKIFDGRKSYSIIYRYNADRTLKPWAVMDSAGDCSYPHLVETPNEILCAYYSQHEDKVCKVFLCAFDKKEFLKQP